LTYLGAPNNDQGEELGLHGHIYNLLAEEIGLLTSIKAIEEIQSELKNF